MTPTKTRPTTSQPHDDYFNPPTTTRPTTGTGQIRYAQNLQTLNAQKNPYGSVPSHTQQRKFHRRNNNNTAGYIADRLRGPFRPSSTSTNFTNFADQQQGNSATRAVPGQGPAHLRPRPATSMPDNGSSHKRLVAVPLPLPTKCNYCGEQFLPTATVDEINNHLDMHVFTDSKF